jgi:transposase InsO family protein
VKPVAEALGVSRPHLNDSSRRAASQRAPYRREGDEELLERIVEVVQARPTYGYRRVTARLNRQRPKQRVNHKRVYRLMSRAKLLLPKYGTKPQRQHNGKVITLASDLRWCSDGFEIRCWNGERVHVAFSLDCCDREVISWVAADWYLSGGDIRDLMAQSVETRFGDTHTPHPVEWLSDNGPPYTATETRAFGAECGLLVCNTPSYSPESNGMAEAFVKTFKRDYVYLSDVPSARAVLEQLSAWFADYNEHHPHKGLNMLSPRQFRRARSA